MNGVLALMEEDAREDFNEHSWGLRARRVQRLEDWLYDILGGPQAGTVSTSDLEQRFAEGIRRESVNDDLIDTCRLTQNTHEMRGEGAHYRVTLDLED